MMQDIFCIHQLLQDVFLQELGLQGIFFQPPPQDQMVGP